MAVKVKGVWTREDGRKFPVFISDKALASWLNERTHAKVIRGLDVDKPMPPDTTAYPDRPPDVDTNGTRQWVSHPGENEKDSPNLKNSVGGGSLADEWDLRPVESVSVRWRTVVAKMLIAQYKDEDRYQCSIVSESLSRPELRQRFDLDGDGAFVADFRERFRATCEAFSTAVGAPDDFIHVEKKEFDKAIARADETLKAIDSWYKENPIP